MSRHELKGRRSKRKRRWDEVCKGIRREDRNEGIREWSGRRRPGGSTEGRVGGSNEREMGGRATKMQGERMEGQMKMGQEEK